jgi:acetyl esterase/lipase
MKLARNYQTKLSFLHSITMKAIIIFVAMSTYNMAIAQLKQIPLYPGPAPGSESWTWHEKTNNNNSLKVMTTFDVVSPSLTVFQPEQAAANGTAIIVCPGGGFHFLAIDHEGTNPARELVKKGITVFILKYRLIHISGGNPFDDMINAKDPKAWDDEALPIIPLAVADGRQAIAYVRSHAAEYKIVSDRIGIMGFSAGGMVAAASAFNYDQQNRPDFVVPVYADMPEAIQSSVNSDAPPLFLACAQDDEFGFASHALNMYKKWYEAKRPVEMHLFVKGGHGFGVGSATNTTNKWIDRLGDWLTTQGLMRAKL